MSFERNRIRLRLELTTPLEDSDDVFRSGPPQMPSGRAVQFELGLFNRGVLDPLASLTSVKLEVKALTAAGIVDVASAALMSATVSAAGFDLTVTQADWDNALKEHVVIGFTQEETGLTVDAATNWRDYKVIVTAQSTGGAVTIGTATLRVVKDGGLTVVTPPPVADPSYVRVDDYLADRQGFVKVENEAGVSFTLRNAEGYGVRFRITAGPQPEVIQETVAPIVG
jgi:hypothetical protein